MTLDQLLEKLNQDFSLDPSVTIEADTELLLSGLIDSLGVVGLVAWLEDQMECSIDPGEIVIENFESPKLIVGLVQQLTAAAS